MRFLSARRIRFTVAMLLGILAAAWFSTLPSNHRDWYPNQAVPAFAEIDGDTITIRNLRDFRYTEDEYDFTPGYDERTYSLQELDSLWFILSPFSRWNGPAHTMLSFGFGDEYVVVSIEARKEADEEYNALPGMLRQFELMYVIGDERDLIQLRTEQYGDDVYLYPVRMEKEHIQSLFLEMLNEANSLYEEPRFYHTFLDTCTNGISRHVNVATGRRTIPFSPKMLAPAFADKFLYDLELIDTELPSSEMREYFRINERATRFKDNEDFSVKIRKFNTL